MRLSAQFVNKHKCDKNISKMTNIWFLRPIQGSMVSGRLQKKII
jgi:hypothetical protein